VFFGGLLYVGSTPVAALNIKGYGVKRSLCNQAISEKQKKGKEVLFHVAYLKARLISSSGVLKLNFAIP